MKTKVIKMLLFGLLLLGATTIYADGGDPPPPWCPNGICPAVTAR